jgi:hypothetical protein
LGFSGSAVSSSFSIEPLVSTPVYWCFDLTTEDEMLVELKKIREALEKAPPPQPPKGLWKEFLDFLSKYKVMGLPVAFVIGLYLGGLVLALVKGLL